MDDEKWSIKQEGIFAPSHWNSVSYKRTNWSYTPFL